MIRNMYIRNGALVIISEVKTLKKYFSFRIFKSLRFRIVLILMLVGIVPGFLMRAIVLGSYERRAVDVRTAEIQNQGTILCDQLADAKELTDGTTELIRAELDQLSNLYSGRILVIDRDFKIVEDTYDLDLGRTIISEDVMKCMDGKSVSSYDAEEGYIEVAAPVVDKESEELEGAVLISVSTDTIMATKDILSRKVNTAQLVFVIVVMAIAILLGNFMVKPFARITQKIGEVSDGFLDAPLREDAYVESSLICDAFNKLMDRLKVIDNSRQEFVSNVSHELKTPLTSMKVLSDSLLLQEDVPVELYKEFMGDLSEEIERENTIINDLLSLVKLDLTAGVMNIQTENINDLVEKILKRLRPIASQKNVELVFESFRPVNADVDVVKFSSAISNLVENAIKYNKDDGWVHVSLNADHKFFYVEVADSGVGIPQEHQEHIFDRFYRVDKSHSREVGGTGLGLAIARNSVIMHRGAIKVFSQPDEGTTFTVKIPITYIV